MPATSVAQQLANVKALRTYVGKPFLQANERLWPLLPRQAREQQMVRRYGRWLHSMVLLRDGDHRTQSLWTCFLRNRAELNYIGRLASAVPNGCTFRVAVLGCSTGAEAFSTVWAMRKANPNISLVVHASDIDAGAIKAAEAAIYRSDARELSGLSDAEREELFEPAGDGWRVRTQWREPISWHVLDARQSGLAEWAGQHDLVLANRFLCHMSPAAARQCLRNVIDLVKPDGLLNVSGVDLGVRSAVTSQAGLTPVADTAEELHNGDPSILKCWPFNYYGLEPLDKSIPDWQRRYSVSYRKRGPGGSGHVTANAMPVSS